MAVAHGKQTVVFVNGVELTSYLRSFSAPANRDQADASVYGGDWKSYVGGQIDASFSCGGIFDGGTAAVDEVFQRAFGGTAVAGTATIANFYPQGEAEGVYGYAWEATETSYEVTAPVSDVVSVSCEMNSASGEGRERVQSLAASTTNRTAAGTATHQDAGATGASNNGCTGYLHVDQITAGTAAVKIQHSTDNSTFTDLVTFANATAVGGQRIEVAGTVSRYTRAIWTYSGGTATFNVSLARR